MIIKKKAINKCMVNDIQDISLRIYGKYDLDKSLIWMTEEFGEVIKAIHKQQNLQEITEEFGDLLAWIFAISNQLGICVEDAIASSFRKEIARQKKVYGQLKYTNEDITL